MSSIHRDQTKDRALAQVPARPGPTTTRRDLGLGEIAPRLVYVVVGLTPIVTLALSLVEVAPLHVIAPVTISAALAIGLSTAVVLHRFRRPVLRGLGTGLLAVFIYDCTRLPFVFFGGWPDFIPRIGAWLMNRPDTHWTVGYLWRYAGNGAGMGLAFAMLVPLLTSPMTRPRAGVLYGLLIWSGLLTTLLVAPNGEEKMFTLTPTTLALSLLGHVVYGAVLGLASRRPLDPD